MTDAAKIVLPKPPTGIAGLDQVTNDGLPKGCTALIYGSAGSEKTALLVASALARSNQVVVVSSGKYLAGHSELKVINIYRPAATKAAQPRVCRPCVDQGFDCPTARVCRR